MSITQLIEEQLKIHTSADTIVTLKGIRLSDLPDSMAGEFLDYDFWKEGIIQSEVLFSDESKELLLEKFMQDSGGLISYEALILALEEIPPFVLKKKKIKILDFSVHQFAFNNLDLELPNLEEEAEKGENIEEAEYQQLIASTLHINGYTFVQYRDGELLDKAEVISVFEPQPWEYKSLPTLPESEINDSHFIFNYDARDYMHQLEKIRSSSPEEVHLLVDNATKVDAGAKEQLGLILDYLKKLGIATRLSRLTYDLTKASRPELNALLKKHWNSDSFRSLKVYADPDISKETIEISQAEIVEAAIEEYENGNLREQQMQDIFLTAPTGAGKSLLFQMPAMYIGEKYGALSIVVTPLKALMVDQVEQLKNKAGYQKVAYINSDITIIQREEVLDSIQQGEIDLLYLAPELLLSYDISHFLGDRKLGLYIVDEAHTVTTWGRDFRVDYWYLGYHISRIRKYGQDANGNPLKFVVMALTATAPYGDRHDVVFETIKSLQIRSAKKYIGYARRDDIEFDIRQREITGNLQTQKVRLAAERIGEFEAAGKKTIVYCPYTNHVSEIIREAAKKDLHPHPYHGRLDRDRKEESYRVFKEEEVVTMVSTKAFGMGVDIDDITQIYHLAPTGLLTDYIQEIGRLARKRGLSGTAMVDYSQRDFQFINVLHGLNRTHNWQLREVMRRLIALYDDSRKQNMLLSADDFAHIFNEDEPDRLQNEVKNALMLLEKDLNAKYSRIPVLIARPKNLFARVFASISEDDFPALQAAMPRDCYRVIPYPPLKEKKKLILQLELDQIWEERFSDKSFGIIKRNFFKEELYENFTLKPKLKVELTINQSGGLTVSRIKEYFLQFSRAFFNLEGFFTKKDFIFQLVSGGMGKDEAERLADYILPLFSQKRGSNPNLRLDDVRPEANFLQVKRDKDKNEFQYRVVNGAWKWLESQLRRKINSTFQSRQHVTKYLTKDSAQKYLYVKIGQILEILDLGSYEVSGGENPRIYVRINDPFRLRSEAYGNYQNELLEDIYQRHLTGVQLMHEFFGTEMTSEERWDFIEEYFLGLKV
ncbi:helicase-related protein [Zeaxanthinibacter sp. PT1]|uniref:helicase-related protein n=1 Tax=Zeaxanthinibacter TaxID=561554 RepID=UPI00234BA7B2|nr:helicase-related protein [Zeaxanthinibacter sp. PT1]MDC6350470.1 helicase-related protein [Zeaxanthinibacter sp. PT1]